MHSELLIGPEEGLYIDGISLTHGAANSQQNISSFVAAVSEIYVLQTIFCVFMFKFGHRTVLYDSCFHRKQLLLW